MAKKDKKKRLLSGSDIALAILAALGGAVAFMTIIAVAGSIILPDSGKRTTAEVPSAQPSYYGTLPSRAPEATPIPAPVEPSNEPEPEPSIAPSEAPTQALASAQVQTPSPTQNPAPAATKAPAQTPTPSRAPAAQTPAPAISVQPVQQSQAPAQSGSQGNNGNWGENSITNEITGDLGRTAYWTNGGRSYHFSRNCPSLSNSRNVNQGTLQDALNAGKRDPCNNCAGGS